MLRNETQLPSLEYSTNILRAEFMHVSKQMEELQEAKKATLKYVIATNSSEQLFLSLIIY